MPIDPAGFVEDRSGMIVDVASTGGRSRWPDLALLRSSCTEACHLARRRLRSRNKMTQTRNAILWTSGSYVGGIPRLL